MSNPPEFARWVWSGLTDPNGSGEVGRAVDAGDWPLPKRAWLDGTVDGVIRLDYGQPEHPYTLEQLTMWQARQKYGNPRAELLTDFVGLCRQPYTAARLCGFVERWGAPEICSHGLLWGHKVKPLHGTTVLIGRPTGCQPLKVDGDEAVRARDLVAWSRRFRAVLNLGAAFRDDPSLDPYKVDRLRTELEVLTGDDVVLAKGITPAAPSLLGQYVDGVLRLTLTRPTFAWPFGSDRGRVQLDTWGPIGAAALQVALALTQVDGFAVCHGCGQPFVPRRMPRAGERSWCPDCGTKAARREASRRWKQRQRQDKGAGNGDTTE